MSLRSSQPYRPQGMAPATIVVTRRRQPVPR